MSCCSNPCLYHRLAPNSLTVHKPGHLGSLRARGGQHTARRIPTLPRYYGNAAAMLSPMLTTYSNHFLEGSHAVLHGSQKKLKPMQKCKKNPFTRGEKISPAAHNHPNILWSIEPFPLPIVLSSSRYLSVRFGIHSPV